MGCASRLLARKEAVESKSRNLAPSGSMEGAGGRSGKSSLSSGSIWAMSAAPGASSSRIRSLSPSRICARRAWTHGQYAGAPPASQQRPQRTFAPRAWASDVGSSASLVLPIPGSPAIKNTDMRPARAPSNAVRNSASSRSRPTNDSAGGGAVRPRGLRRPLPLFRDRALEIECGILFQDRGLELLQRSSGFDAELLDEGPAGGSVGVQRLGLSSGAVEGEHELRSRSFAQRLLGDKALELADHLGVPSPLEVGLDAVLESGEAHLFQA